MNNWRLLLLAVVAVLQPIGSFTEPNLIDGHQECCDHRSNSITQETRLYGTYRKTNPEDRRLNTRITEDIREERRYEGRNDPITRSRQRLTLERAGRRISPESPVRFTEESRFAKNQDRRQTVSFGVRETRQIREDQSRRSRDSDALDSRRVRISRDDRAGRRDSLEARDARRVQNSVDQRRVSNNREIMSVIRQEQDDIAREIRHVARISVLRSIENRESRFDHRARERSTVNGRARSLDSRENNVNERVDPMSRVESREIRRSSDRTISEQVDERRRDDYRESNNRTSTVRRDSSERISADRRRESRDSIERVDRARKEIKENKERTDERRQQRDESRLPRERSSKLRKSGVSTSAARRQARESRILDGVRSERIVRNNNRVDARLETSRNLLRTSSEVTAERRQDSRVSRTLEATSRNERLVRSDERKDERRQPSSRSVDRVSILRSSHVSRSIQREYDSLSSAQLPERDVRNDRAARYRRDTRSVERLDERREHRDESLMSRDRTPSVLRETRNSDERRQESRRVATLSRFDVNAQRESKIRSDVRDSAAPREQNLRRMARNTERRADRELSGISRFSARVSSDDRAPRVRGDARSERLDIRRETQDKNIETRERTLSLQHLARDLSTPQQRLDTYRASRNVETNARSQRTRSLDGIGDERREMRQRDETRATRNTFSMSRLSRERIDDQRRVARQNTRDSRVDARNEVTRNRRDVRMGERFKARNQYESRFGRISLERLQSRDILAARSVERRSRDIASRDGEMNVRSERLARNRDRRINERDVRNNNRDLDVESQESRRTINREVQANRHNLAMERMSRVAVNANRDTRIEAKLRSSDAVISRDVRMETKRDVDTRFGNFAAKISEIDSSDKTPENQNAMTWQMVFYTLQGAYLCGLLMHMLTEKSNQTKSRNFTWWASSSKDLVKVD